MMESFDDSGSAAVGCGIRKKRSNASRRPRLDSNVLLQSNSLLPPSTQPISNESYDTNQCNEDKAVLCDGLGSENKLKRLKLKFGGVTHTIHSNSVADKSSSCFTDFTSQEKLLLQVLCTNFFTYNLLINPSFFFETMSNVHYCDGWSLKIP